MDMLFTEMEGIYAHILTWSHHMKGEFQNPPNQGEKFILSN